MKKNKALVAITAVSISALIALDMNTSKLTKIINQEVISLQSEAVVLETDSLKSLAKIARPSLTRIEKSIQRKHPLLIENQKLRAKALLTREEELKLDKYFSNSRNIRVAFLTLKNKKFGDFYKRTLHRIDAVNFLTDGLKRKHIDNDEILKSIQMFLLSNMENDLPLKEKRAVIGDKIDLYFAMLKHAPLESVKFKQNYMSERLVKVIKYVENHTQKNKRRENEK